MECKLIIIDKIYESIESSVTIDKECKALYISRLQALNFSTIESLYNSSLKTLTSLDIKYVICFLIDMSCGDIALLFNIEPSSVHMARYRIKKKFATINTWSF